MPTHTEFQVTGSLECTYSRGVEHVTSRIYMAEPAPSAFFDRQKQVAWFRQPLTLVELRQAGPGVVQVRRTRTSSAALGDQGGELLEFLKSHAC